MADSKTSALTAVASVTGTQEIPVNDGGTSKKATPAQFLTYIEGAIGTAAFRTLIDDADTTALRASLGLVIGTNVQAYDAELAALAGLTSAADKGIQFTGAGTAGTYDLTTAGKALLDDADASAQRTTLGLGSVENTALSTWAGSANITTLGTIGTGTWQGAVVDSTYGGTGVNNAGRTLTIATNSGTLTFSSASSTLTVPATGTAALLGTANNFTATQSIYDSGSALALTLAGAAGGGTVAIAATVPAQVASATAGTPLSITASAAIAGSSNAGAAAGGAITITSGAAARLSSGNAAGGDINLTPGAGIGSSGAGSVVVATTTANTAAAIKFGTTSTGFHSTTNNTIQLFTNGLNTGAFNFHSTGGLATTLKLGWRGSISDSNGTPDTAFFRNAQAVIEANNGTNGAWAALKAGTNDTSNASTTIGLTLGHQRSSGSAVAAGFGMGVLFNLESTTTADQNAGQIETVWTTATHASRTSAMVFSTVNNAGALTERTRIDTGVTITNAGIGTTSTDGLLLTNTTAAAAGAQQYSPRLHLRGQGWKTNATAASQSVDWIVENRPVQGAVNPTGALTFGVSVAGGAQINHLTITGDGVNIGSVTLTSATLTCAQLVTLNTGIDVGTGWWRIDGSGGASSGIGFGSGQLITWKSTTTSSAVTGGDIGLARNAAGIIEINNGTAGQWGALKAGTRDAGTTTIVDGITIGHQSSGTPDAGLGTGLMLNINSTTTADQNALRMTAEWVVATHASRTARAKFQVYDTAAREALRLEASGSAALIGFLGATAVGVQSVGAAATDAATTQTLCNNLRTALINFGLATT